jgi:hypothetical protein
VLLIVAGACGIVGSALTGECVVTLDGIIDTMTRYKDHARIVSTSDLLLQPGTHHSPHRLALSSVNSRFNLPIQQTFLFCMAQQSHVLGCKIRLPIPLCW